MIIEHYPEWIKENHPALPGLDKLLVRLRFLKVSIAVSSAWSGGLWVWVLDALPQHAELLEFEGFTCRGENSDGNYCWCRKVGPS